MESLTCSVQSGAEGPHTQTLCVLVTSSLCEVWAGCEWHYVCVCVGGGRSSCSQASGSQHQHWVSSSEDVGRFTTTLEISTHEDFLSLNSSYSVWTHSFMFAMHLSAVSSVRPSPLLERGCTVENLGNIIHGESYHRLHSQYSPGATSCFYSCVSEMFSCTFTLL